MANDVRRRGRMAGPLCEDAMAAAYRPVLRKKWTGVAFLTILRKALVRLGGKAARASAAPEDL